MATPNENQNSENTRDRKPSSDKNGAGDSVRTNQNQLSSRTRNVAEGIAALERLSDVDMAYAIKMSLLGPLNRNNPTNGVYLGIELLLDELLGVEPTAEVPGRARDAQSRIVTHLASAAQGNFRSDQDDAASLRKLAFCIWQWEQVAVPLQYKAEGIVEDVENWRDDVARRRKPTINVGEICRALEKRKLALRVAHVALATGVVPGDKDGDLRRAINKAKGALKNSPW